MPFVSGTDLIALQSASPPIPLIVRSAKMMLGGVCRTWSSADWPSATTFDLYPFRCRTRAISRATCGSSSTTRMVSVLKLNAHLLAQVPSDGAHERTERIRQRVDPARHASRQKVLPDLHRHGEQQTGDERQKISLETRAPRCVQRQ